MISLEIELTLLIIASSELPGTTKFFDRPMNVEDRMFDVSVNIFRTNQRRRQTYSETIFYVSLFSFFSFLLRHPV